MSIIGNKTINYAIYDRTDGWAKPVTETTSYKRPSLGMLTGTIEGGGINGEIELPALAQLEAMEFEIDLKKTNEDAITLFAPGSHKIEIRWANDAIDSATGKVMVGGNKEIIIYVPMSFDMGKVEKNETNDAKLKGQILYYQYIQGGVSLIEIDRLNNIFKINGVDYAASIRDAL